MASRLVIAVSSVAVRLVLGFTVLLAAGALWIDGPAPPWLAAMLAALCLSTGLAMLLAVRSLVSTVGLVATLVAAVGAWWLSIPPQQDRDWALDVAHPADVSWDGSRFTISDVRNFTYRTATDFDPVWETRTYDLDEVIGADLFISYWGPTLYAHTIASWEFRDGRHLAISIETRRERGEEYSALLGFFRQFELYYVVADERDLIGVRAAHRGEEVFLYRTAASAERARAILRSYLERVHELARQPAWYNALTQNCTTADSRPCRSGGSRRCRLGLARAGQRPSRRARLRARLDQQRPAVRRATPPQRHHRTGPRGRWRSGILRAHPRGPSGAPDASLAHQALVDLAPGAALGDHRRDVRMTGPFGDQAAHPLVGRIARVGRQRVGDFAEFPEASSRRRR